MRHRSKIGMARAAGVGALTACGLLMSLVGPAEGQGRVSNAGDTTRGARPGGLGYAGLGQDTQLLIAHGLEMAIEGSTLQALAMRPGGMVGEPGMAAPGAGRAGSRVEPASGPRAGTPSTTPGLLGRPGSPVTGAPGGAVVERPVTPATEGGSRFAAPGAAANAAPIPMTAGPSAAILRQQAQHAFEDSDRLLAQAGRDTVADRRLPEAATRYAAALRSFGASPIAPTGPGLVGNGTGGSGTFPSATSATGVGGTGNPVTGPGGVAAATGSASAPGAGGIAASPGPMNDVDLASVAAINHEVKEALGALKIRQMYRTAGSSDSPAAQFLLTHARQMEAQGRSTIQSILGGAATTPSGPIQALAQQANDLILALQGTGG